jgi:hypothetical protein
MATFKEVIRKIQLEVRDLIVGRPDLSYKQIGSLFDISEATVVKTAQRFDLPRRPVGRKRKTQKGS